MGHSKLVNKISFILENCSPTLEALSAIKITKNIQFSLAKEFLNINDANRGDLDLFYHFFKVIVNQITNETDLQRLQELCIGNDLKLSSIVLEAILLHNPNNPDIEITLAQNYSKLGDHAKSFDSYVKTIELLVSGRSSKMNLSDLVNLFEVEAAKCPKKHQKMIEILAKAKLAGCESDTYYQEVDAYIKGNSISVLRSFENESRKSPQSTEPSNKKLSKKKSIKFPEWVINGKTISLEDKYVVQVNGLGHKNCYASITKDVFENFDAGTKCKFKTAICKAAAQENETGIKKFDGIYELKIKGSNCDGDIRLTASNTFKGLNEELLIVFDEAGDHSTVAKASPTLEIEYGASEATAANLYYHPKLTAIKRFCKTCLCAHIKYMLTQASLLNHISAI